ncbi:MAG: hypothetical protein ABJH98_06800 [Reichenbachiella sp.]|uniref:hypothetical protein n=1 Tax=Reichenbachiella sp. TaxID=2184521 RepID=UPI0032973765
MKKSIFLYCILFFVVGVLSSCGDDDEETCDEFEVCTNESATSCCTCADDSCCTYTYDGVEYDTADEAADAIGCGGTAEKAQLIGILKAARTRAKANF